MNLGTTGVDEGKFYSEFEKVYFTITCAGSRTVVILQCSSCNVLSPSIVILCVIPCIANLR